MEACPSTLVPLVRDGCPKCGHVEIWQAEQILPMKSFGGNHMDAIYRSSVVPIFCSGSSHLDHIDDDIISSLCPNYVLQRGIFGNFENIGDSSKYSRDLLVFFFVIVTSK